MENIGIKWLSELLKIGKWLHQGQTNHYSTDFEHRYGISFLEFKQIATIKKIIKI